MSEKCCKSPKNKQQVIGSIVLTVLLNITIFGLVAVCIKYRKKDQ
jgi:hypothetical protein